MDTRPVCKYGEQCYRKNEEHLKKYAHSSNAKKAKAGEELCVTVVNRTEYDVGPGKITSGGGTDEMRAKGSTCYYGGGESVPAGKSITVTLKGEYDGAPMTWHLLSLRTKGLQWASAAQTTTQWDPHTKILAVEPGGSYDIVVDEAARPLTEAQTGTVTQALFDALEHCVPTSKIWDYVTERLPASLLQGRSSKQLSTVYSCDDHGRWRQWYKPMVPAPNTTAEQVANALAGTSYRMDVYFRALDRFPGGNADIHTVCYRLSPVHGVLAREHSNWDGDQHDTLFKPPALNKKLKEVLANIGERVLDCARRTGVDSECTLSDLKTMDDEEYDTEWTSFEVLLMVPLEWSPSTHALFDASDRRSITTFLLVHARLGRPFPRDVLHKVFQELVLLPTGPQRWRPVFRLHQFSIPGIEQYSWARAKQAAPPKPIVPSAQQKALIDCVYEAIGMGRVNEYTDAGDGEEPCKAAGEKNAGLLPERKGLGRAYVPLPYLQPHYFRADWE